MYDDENYNVASISTKSNLYTNDSMFFYSLACINHYTSTYSQSIGKEIKNCVKEIRKCQKREKKKPDLNTHYNNMLKQTRNYSYFEPIPRKRNNRLF